MAAKALEVEQLKQILRLRRDSFPLKAIICYTDIKITALKTNT